MGGGAARKKATGDSKKEWEGCSGSRTLMTLK